MRRNAPARSMLRCAQFERYEDRLVFSSVLWSDVCAQPAHDLTNTAPDWLEMAPATELTGSITNSSSELQHVRNTYGFYGHGQTVAIIDSGIAWDHVALGGGLGESYRVVGGWDFTEENDANPYDDGPAGFHGTHVAGIVGAEDKKHSGVAPGVDLVALRVFNDQGLGQISWVEQALSWVHNNKDRFQFPITTVNLSLGLQWNGSAPPSWAVLEDELALLAQDGIFVSVAAGNSFADYGRPGLAYPAASPHVVPVASVDDDGMLSDYSQRNSRVLAAPGEFVTSTVPDHIFGTDGDVDDWAAASGTSMAAPYLAGASVLVREAMQFVGHASITQSDIYSHLRSTADWVFDPATSARYQRLNLTRSIDSLLPADDYSSSLDAPFDLGTLGQNRAVSGLLTRLDDQDVFQFTATVTGQLTWDAAGCHSFDVVITNSEQAKRSNDASVRVEAGQTYTFVVTAGERLTDYNVELSITPEKLVTVDGNVVRVNGTSGDDVIRFSVGSAYRIEINDQQYTFVADRPWKFEIHGGGGSDELALSGSRQSDHVTLRAGSAEMSGAGYELSGNGFDRINASAGGGARDIVRLHGTNGNDQFVASRESATMSGVGYSNRAEGFDRMYAYAGAGGDDVARLYDSAGDDEYIARPSSGVLQGSDYFIKAWSFDRLYAYASSGKDTARFFDSQGDEAFIGTPQAAWMQGEAFFRKAWNFDRVYAYARSGGNDVARLYDSPGDDLFVGTLHAGSLRGESHFYKAWHFDRVYAYASRGDDQAVLTGSTGNDSFVARATNSSLRGDSYFHKAWDFERVYADASNGGYDVARFFDSPQNDIFIGTHGSSVLQGEAFLARADRFDQVFAIPVEGAGVDLASSPDLTCDDDLCSWDDQTTLRVAGLGRLMSAVESLESVRKRLVSGPDVSSRDTDRLSNHDNGESIRGDERLDLCRPPNEGIDLAAAIAAVMRHELNRREQPDVDRGLLGELYLATLDDLFESLDE